MSQSAISGLAVLVVLTFVALVLASCASSEHAAVEAPVEVASVEPTGVPEFHGAHIGRDALRDRLLTE